MARQLTESALTQRSASELARAIREREVSAREVVAAHIELHRRFAPRVNAVVADRYGEALADADAADARVASAAERSGTWPAPLLGVPFTVKESIALAGMPQSSGLVARRDYCSTESAPVVQRLLDAGAIALGVTNTSELTLWIESQNQVYGRTNNPYDGSRTAGGSSGGEGAAVGCGGSPFGVAADIGGSIRLPAFFCGAFGHKPSAGLLPNTGMFPMSPGDAGRLLQPGPIARRATDLMPLIRVMAGPDGADPLVREVELGDPAGVSLAGLQVTTVEDSSVLPFTQELRDARERAVGALLAAGAEVRGVSFPLWRRATLPFLAELTAGGEQITIGLLSDAGEAAPTLMSLAHRGGDHTLPTRITLALELLPQMTDNQRARLIDQGRRLASELVEAIGDGVLLHPAHRRVAPRHGRTVGRPWLLTPASVFNLAGVPVTEVPLGLNGDGVPLGVQVAAGMDRDHVAIAVALELERVFGGWVPPPAP